MGRLHTSIFLILSLAVVTAASAAPNINIWYGLNQSFGHIGNPQAAINILGNVSDANGIQSLTYKVNGGSAVTLNWGPDTRRLLKQGDFNADINTSSLNNGANSVLITATNTLNEVTNTTVTVNYTTGQTWPTTYTINWGSASTINSVAQVVDGHWTLFGGTIKPTQTQLGYDRLVAIGNKTWTDYEVTVPITIISIDSSGFNYPSNGPGIGLLFRWTGHTDNPVSGWQPKTGYLPLGAIAWYNWDTTPETGARLRMHGNFLSTLASDNSGFTMTFNVTYMFKMRVAGTEYKLKVWQQGQAEPTTWNLSATQNPADDPLAGSALLVAHHVYATFGNITVSPLPDVTPPVISNIQSSQGATTATISWNTNENATSQILYGLTDAYELGSLNDASLVLAHSMQLNGLSPATTYHYSVHSTDASSNTGSSTDQTFTTNSVSITSDDFNQGSLNTSLWTFVNRLGDATLSMTGSQLSLSVPGGTGHDIWESGNYSARVVQPVTNSDFEIQAKFDTPMSQTYQIEGIVVEQDSNNFMRFDFYYEFGATKVFSATIVNGGATIRTNTVITVPSQSPLYLKVKRQGNLWTQSYSFDGANWTVVAGSPFSYVITPTKVGPFIGNAGGTPPAFTCLIDYFVNLNEVVRPNIKAFLQGPFATPGDSLRTTLRSLLPLTQPYAAAPWSYPGTESVGSIPDSVVDWVLMELRTGTAAATKVGTRAAFIKRSGRVVDTDGSSSVTFPGVKAGSYYVVLRHRNHLPVMTASAIALATSSPLYSFATAQTQAYGSSPMVELATGVYGLVAGDANTSLVITAADANDVFGSINSTTYTVKDVNLSGIVTSADANIVFGNLNKSNQVP